MQSSRGLKKQGRRHRRRQGLARGRTLLIRALGRSPFSSKNSRRRSLSSRCFSAACRGQECDGALSGPLSALARARSSESDMQVPLEVTESFPLRWAPAVTPSLCAVLPEPDLLRQHFASEHRARGRHSRAGRSREAHRSSSAQSRRSDSLGQRHWSGVVADNGLVERTMQRTASLGDLGNRQQQQCGANGSVGGSGRAHSSLLLAAWLVDETHLLSISRVSLLPVLQQTRGRHACTEDKDRRIISLLDA